MGGHICSNRVQKMSSFRQSDVLCVSKSRRFSLFNSLVLSRKTCRLSACRPHPNALPSGRQRLLSCRASLPPSIWCISAWHREIRVVKIRLSQISSSQIDPPQIGFPEIGPSQVHVTQHSLVEVNLHRVQHAPRCGKPLEICTQVRVTQIRPTHPGKSQVREA